MKIDNLYEGQVFKNYRILCEELEMPIRTSNAKKAQLKELGRFCSMIKEGHEIIIEDVFDVPLPKIDGRGSARLKTPLRESNPRLAKEWLARENGFPLNDSITRTSLGSYWWECMECKRKIYSSLRKRLKIKGVSTDEDVSCLYCVLSEGAKKVADVLIEIGLKFTTEYTFKDLKGDGGGLLRYDFAVLSSEDEVDMLVEYDGEFHFYAIGGVDVNDSTKKLELTQEHDSRKNHYCTESGISLVRIAFFESDVVRSKIDECIRQLRQGSVYISPSPKEIDPAEVLIRNLILTIDADIEKTKEKVASLENKKNDLIKELDSFSSTFGGGNS